MADFVRARSAEHKRERMGEIKAAARDLFATRPYHEITLSTIAERLSWTRANLYKYVTSKEEVFLELCADAMGAYFDALDAAFPPGCGYGPDTIAQVWTGTIAAHRDYLRYCDILPSIIETNVSVDRLAAFKTRYYGWTDRFAATLRGLLGIDAGRAYDLFLAVHYHAVGIDGLGRWNPLVEDALERAGIVPPAIDFRDNVAEFIRAMIAHYAPERRAGEV